MMGSRLQRLTRRQAGALLAAMVALPASVAAAVTPSAGIPPAYQAIVVEPSVGPAGSEFDLTPALERARRENKRLYVYLGADDCRYCRRYESFLARNAEELLPHFRSWLIVDLRSTLSTTQARLFFRVGGRSLAYADFQRSIGDERARMLVYPSVWLFSPQLRPLMPMPAGTGTFETVAEQLEILNLVQ
jgi:hypothetical protein